MKKITFNINGLTISMIYGHCLYQLVNSIVPLNYTLKNDLFQDEMTTYKRLIIFRAWLEYHDENLITSLFVYKIICSNLKPDDLIPKLMRNRIGLLLLLHIDAGNYWNCREYAKKILPMKIISALDISSYMGSMLDDEWKKTIGDYLNNLSKQWMKLGKEYYHEYLAYLNSRYN